MNKDVLNQSQWSEEAAGWLRHSISAVDDFVDARWRQLKSRFAWDGVPRIQPYIGFANDDFAWLHGRVLTNPPKDLPSEDDNWWDNVVQMYRRFESDEVPGVEVEIEFSGQRHRVITDDEGYFHLETANSPDVRGSLPWKKSAMRIINHDLIGPDDSLTSARMLTPPATARFGIISDIDDTVLQTGMTGLLTAARLTFLHNAQTRKPLTGVAALYRALQAGLSEEQPQQNPIFYVSSSPWNLFDLLEDFLELNGIPPGPILLRDLGFDRNKFLKEGHEHKLEKVKRIMAAYPHLPFILIGDSGQDDAALYATAAKANPQQVAGIFIRDVDPAADSQFDISAKEAIRIAESEGVPMHLVSDSHVIATLAERMRLIAPRWVPIVEAETVKDKFRQPPELI